MGALDRAGAGAKAVRRAVLEAVFAALDDVNAERPARERLAKSARTRLFSPSGGLDSLAALDLIIGIEDRLRERFGRSVEIAGYGSGAAEPLRTVGSLADHICRRIARTPMSRP